MTVKICTNSATFPQASEALKVRWIIITPSSFSMVSDCAVYSALMSQLSMTNASSPGTTSPSTSLMINDASVGYKKLGAMVSRTAICRVSTRTFPAASVA